MNFPACQYDQLHCLPGLGCWRSRRSLYPNIPPPEQTRVNQGQHVSGPYVVLPSLLYPIAASHRDSGYAFFLVPVPSLPNFACFLTFSMTAPLPRVHNEVVAPSFFHSFSMTADILLLNNAATQVDDGDAYLFAVFEPSVRRSMVCSFGGRICGWHTL